MSKKTHQNLDQEEQELFDSFEREEWIESEEVLKEMSFAKEAASNYFKKNARINIRLSEADLKKIKQLAAYEGMPYQTLIGSLLHKYAAGHLKFS